VKPPPLTGHHGSSSRFSDTNCRLGVCLSVSETRPARGRLTLPRPEQSSTMRSMWKYAATKMGLRKKTPSMDPALTRPRGLYDTRDVDLRKLKRLIVAGKLAPCYAAEEARDPDEDPASGADDSESRPELEECPICFLGYPCLNRSKCCASSICTECFLQVKAPEPRLTPRCPFCKTPGYSVRFKGKKTASERATEAEEEASVAAARERFRAEQLRLERARAHARRSAARTRATAEDPSDDPSSSRASASSSSPPSAAATAPNASASASPIPVVPVGWEEEYAAMTPQRRNPEALRRGGRSWTPPAPPSPLPSVPSRWRAEADERRVRTLDRRSARSGAFALGSNVSARGRGRGESGADRPRRFLSPRRLDDPDDPDVDAVGVRFDEEYREVEDERAEAREASRRRERRAARARRRDRDAGPEDALDPEYLRRIQEYVPAHLLDDPPPRETLVAAGNLDIEDVMMMEALYLSLRDGEEEDERRRREEAEAAAEAAEVEAAIAAVAAVEAAEAAEAAARRASGEFAESERAHEHEHEHEHERVDEHAEDDDDRSSSTAALDAEAERVTRLRMSSGVRGGTSAVHPENLAQARRVATATRREEGGEERYEGERERERERGFRADASAGGEGSSSKARVVDPGPPGAPDSPEESPEDRRPARAPAKTSAAEAVERAAAETEAVAMQMEALHARADELERAEASVEALLERLYAEESPGPSRGDRAAPEPEPAVVPETDVRARTRTVHLPSPPEDEETTGEAREAPHPSANQPEPEPEPEGETETESTEPGAEAEAESLARDAVADRAETA
jgi:hypothetical protein